MRILVAEDEERSRKGISRLIRSIDSDYCVIAQVANGLEALEKIRSCRPDLVVTDIKMPVMDGLELIEAVCAEKLYPHFVIMSAFAEFEYAQKAMSFGVREFLVKPVTYDDVEQVLLRVSQLPRDPKYARKILNLHPLVSKTVGAIKDNYMQRLSLESLAEALDVTPEYLSTLFSREIGEPFSAYLQKYRVERAKEALSQSGVRIYEVAASVGFSDVKYFCKVFKKVIGVSPSQYQKTCEYSEY